MMIFIFLMLDKRFGIRPGACILKTQRFSVCFKTGKKEEETESEIKTEEKSGAPEDALQDEEQRQVLETTLTLHSYYPLMKNQSSGQSFERGVERLSIARRVFGGFFPKDEGSAKASPKKDQEGRGEGEVGRSLFESKNLEARL